LFDYALINRTPASENLKAKYALEGATQIVADLDVIEHLGCCPVLGDYLEEESVARHATDIVGGGICWRSPHMRRAGGAQGSPIPNAAMWLSK